MFELPAGNGSDSRERALAKHSLHIERNCIACNWSFYSIYGSSHLGGGFLAAFEMKRGEQGASFHSSSERRQFDELVLDNAIFDGQQDPGRAMENGLSGYSWGAQEKLYQLKDGAVRVVRYKPGAYRPWDRFVEIGKIELGNRHDQLVSAEAAVFGAVIEYDDGLLVVPSDSEEVIALSGEPVNWRIFPRSKHYVNQLHVIYADRLEVLSFNHDYFTDQRWKKSGIAYRPSQSRGWG